MPVEIRELLIKVAVDESAGKQNAGNSEQQGGGNPEEIVKLCVEKVLEVIKEQKER
ncbi:hypothetical protein LX64_01637 [Chitinophaga skermanii]|uniref:Uncharacterized protein n=1 Tax=Chitinophaga skermanii TaxID=331697 RepID=A0A327QQ85_9BACT|nr:DUF5908 family protein [Chitinophaga skermanii]RAJ06510.1 hypothetical protein LX64_01637 [Chitinophaga skermanii]